MKLVLCTLAAVLIFSAAHVLSHHYVIASGGNGAIMWKVDQLTGQITICYVQDGPRTVCEKVKH
jgi:hypothetical protein